MSPRSIEANAQSTTPATPSATPSATHFASDDKKWHSSFSNAEISASTRPNTRLNRRLVSYDEIPDWYQDNPYIRHGYRPVLQSARACFSSWSYVHNETLNIYTHLVPAAVLLVIGLSYVLIRLSGRSSDDIGVAVALLVCAVGCLSFSSLYHTLMCHSRSIEAFWLRLDFIGIILLILGSFISGIYVGFWCETLQRRIYFSMMGSLAAISIVVVLAPCFQGPRWRTLRLLTFVFTGLSGLIPIIHGIVMFGFMQMAKQSGLFYFLAEGGLFLIGAVVYATRFPESIRPGTFDIYGSSHQIFHVLVVFATVIHLIGVLDALDYNYYNRQCPG